MTTTPSIVVLADLAPPGTSIDLEPCDRVTVEKNGLSAALRLVRPALELDLDDFERLSPSALRHASFVVGWSADRARAHREGFPLAAHLQAQMEKYGGELPQLRVTKKVSTPPLRSAVRAHQCTYALTDLCIE